MAVVLAVAAGGSVGAVARYGVMTLVDRHATPEWLRVGLVLGFVGAYTTFSTFAQDLYDLTAARQFAAASLNFVGSVMLGVLAVVAGTWVGRLL